MRPIAKKPLTPAERREEMKENLIAVGIIILLCLAVVWWIWMRLHPEEPTDAPRIMIPQGGSPALGRDDAPVTVVLYSDFTCTFCSEFARKHLPVIRQRFVDTGRVRIIFKEFPLSSHEYAEPAAVAALCAHEEDAFWTYHDLLFSSEKPLTDEVLLALAVKAGIDQERFTTCIARGTGMVDADKTFGMKAGVSGTPTFFFNGRRVVGALTPDDFGAELVQEPLS